MSNDIYEQEIGETETMAEASKQLMGSDVFNRAYEMMNHGIVEQILQTPAESDKERERLYAMFKAGQMFVQQFATLINNLELRNQQEGE
jgi:hypothetical protein|tara:strand:+ start:309 stop:575 length:267 start_codon:yes stop_codon:yes gene_type:complete